MIVYIKNFSLGFRTFYKENQAIQGTLVIS